MNLRDYLDRLLPFVKAIDSASISDVGIYGCVLRAALVKSFEFAILVNSVDTPSHSFYLTASLRGICEDLIVLTFISGFLDEDRNDVLSLLIHDKLGEGIESQANFFASMRPWQPVVRPRKDEKVSKRSRDQKLKIFAKRRGWNGRQAWPTVWFMAKSCSLDAVYQYLYSATSKWVHFSPHVLLRMGWGGSREDFGNHTKWNFTF